MLEPWNQYEDHISAVSLMEQVLNPSFRGAITTYPLSSGLHCASLSGIVELVTVLINGEGYKVDQQDCAGLTPLAWAASGGHEGVDKLWFNPTRRCCFQRTQISGTVAVGTGRCRPKSP